MFLLIALALARHRRSDLTRMVRREIARQYVLQSKKATNEDFSPPILGVNPPTYTTPQYLPVMGGTFMTPQGIQRRGFQYTLPGSILTSSQPQTRSKTRRNVYTQQGREPVYGRPYVTGRVPTLARRVVESRYVDESQRRSRTRRGWRHRGQQTSRSLTDLMHDWVSDPRELVRTPYMLTLGVFPLDPED